MASPIYRVPSSLFIDTSSDKATIQKDSIGTANTVGESLLNNSAGGSGAPQFSPGIELVGAGYSTGGSASVTNKWLIQAQNVSGTYAPVSSRQGDGYISFLESYNGGGYTQIATIDAYGITAPHFVGSGVPTITTGGASSGGSFAISISGTDIAGIITITIGSSSGSGNLAIITFNKPFAVAPVVIAHGTDQTTVGNWVPTYTASAGGATKGWYVYGANVSNKSFTVTDFSGGWDTNGTVCNIAYQVIGRQV